MRENPYKIVKLNGNPDRRKVHSSVHTTADLQCGPYRPTASRQLRTRSPVPASYRHARVAHPREKRSLPDAPEAVFRHPSTHRTDPPMPPQFTPFPPLPHLAPDLP